MATVLSAPRPKPRSVRHFWPLATRFPSFISLVCPPPSLSFLCPTMGFPESSAGKESTCNVGDLGSIPGSGRSPGEGKGYPLQVSWSSLVAQLVKNPPAMWETWARSLGWEDPLEKGILPTPVFWPGEFHGLYSPQDFRVRHD